MCKIIKTTRFKNLVRINHLACMAFEERLSSLVKEYSEKEKDTKGKNEILRKWYNLCNENYYIEREMIKEYLRGDDIKGEHHDIKQYRRQIGSRIYPLFVSFINSFEYICEVLYLNSPTLQQELKKNKERSFIREYIKVFSNLDYIDKNQEQLLFNFWSMRNAMHRQNFPREEIEFKLKDYTNGNILQYKVDKGEVVYTPEWGLDKITEVMSSIMVDIINNIPDLKVKNIEDIN